MDMATEPGSECRGVMHVVALLLKNGGKVTLEKLWHIIIHVINLNAIFEGLVCTYTFILELTMFCRSGQLLQCMCTHDFSVQSD